MTKKGFWDKQDNKGKHSPTKTIDKVIEEQRVCDDDAEELLNFAAELKELKRLRESPNTTKEEKVAWVKRAEQEREHHCHWPGCTKQVPPAMWGCYKHWMKLPKYLRDRVWAAYRPGQEKDMKPSESYLTVAREVRQWIKDNYGDDVP